MAVKEDRAQAPGPEKASIHNRDALWVSRDTLGPLSVQSTAGKPLANRNAELRGLILSHSMHIVNHMRVHSLAMAGYTTAQLRKVTVTVD